MKVLFDTMVIIYAVERQDALGDWARGVLAEAVAGEGGVVNAVVLAEYGAGVAEPGSVMPALEKLGIEIVDLPAECSAAAARAFKTFKQRSKAEGQRRGKTLLPDFFLGAHAEAEQWRVATNDADHYATYFKTVPLIQPPAEHAA